MSLASIFNIPSSPEQMAAWSFSHMANHRDIIRLIYERGGVILDEYAIDPINLADPKGFLDNHQILHQQFSAVLGLSGFDLSDVDFNQKEQLAVWIDLNARSHRAACDILGLS